MTSPIAPTGRSESGVEPAPACTLVIFGAGGDLTKRLLMPALYNLTGSGLLDEATTILGIDRQKQTSEAWRAGLGETMQSFTKDQSAEFHVPSIDADVWNRVAERLHYVEGDFLSPDTHRALAGRIKGNALFYLAVASRFFAPIAEALGAAGLLKEDGNSFRRLVVEKPFGSDLASAKELNARLLAVAAEEQIYRIDHFLGKETVQSIMAVRFANGMFEPVWRREHVEYVEITAAETIGVEGRGAFYEPTGALRDMVPNHLFQLLCMTAMEPPVSFDAEAVRDEKAKLIAAIRPVEPGDAVRGQYEAGSLDGSDLPAYRHEPNVAADSRTETYAALKLTIDNWRWAGVPFYLRTGKRMAARRTEIALHFRPAPTRIFKDTPVSDTVPNVLRLQMDPEQGIRTEFSAKIPGPAMRLGAVATTFRYGDFFEERPNVGYETLLYDCMMGDATLFQRADAIEGAWRVVEPLIESWGAGGEPDGYAVGSQGPAAADRLLGRDGHGWSPLAAS
ncbi:glucose-6-phosphate dehydrogenase [Aureimonas leprariae]|uniref:Glucose-6-phosphate 1-dehydrogenase n=1 Tax=Plantimonas leprariae TaxID=2615207 RepID=A0A7V7TVV2_9HYPH|nr:glucose-6-phosphate dehydrogenase [Aureimonas leprariae]KAB0678492.1 glucose-6-phosphate dehydrogenase [Aureimonas leprariae]